MRKIVITIAFAVIANMTYAQNPGKFGFVLSKSFQAPKTITQVQEKAEKEILRQHPEIRNIPIYPQPMPIIKPVQLPPVPDISRYQLPTLPSINKSQKDTRPSASKVKK